MNGSVNRDMSRQMVLRPLVYATAWVLLGASTAGAADVTVLVMTTGKRTTRAKNEKALRNAIDTRRDIVAVAQDRQASLFARGSPEPQRPPLRDLRRSMRRAAKAFDVFKLERARNAVDRAYAALGPHRGLPQTHEIELELSILRVAIAHAARDETQVAEALADHARRFDSAPTKRWPPDLLGRLETLRPEKQGRLTVRSSPASTVFVDGVERGETPLSLTDLVGGDHRIVMRATGFDSDSVDVRIDGKVPQRVDRILVRNWQATFGALDADAPIDAALLRALAPKLNEVSADALLIVGPRTNEKGLILRWVVFGAEGFVTEDNRVSVRSHEQLVDALRQLRAPPLADTPLAAAASGDLWVWMGIGTGVAAAGAGTALHLMARSSRLKLDAMDGALTQRQAYELRARGQREQVAGAVLITLGSVAVAGLTSWLFVDRPSEGEL